MQPVQVVCEMLLQRLICTIMLALLAVFKATAASLDSIFRIPDLSLLAFATAYFLSTALQASEDSPPLEVEKSDQHERSTEDDRDVERPSEELLCVLLHFNALVVNFESRGRLAISSYASATGATRDDPHFIDRVE